MRNRIPICVILLLATASVLFAAETEMQRFREEVEASRANMDFFVQQIRRNLITEVRGNVTESEIDSVTTAQAALTQSEVAVTSHNFRDALRFLYLSAILHLQERGILTYDKSLTNLEYLHTLQAHVELQEALRPVIQVFDDVWYGYKPCNADTIANYRELLQKVYLTNG